MMPGAPTSALAASQEPELEAAGPVPAVRPFPSQQLVFLCCALQWAFWAAGGRGMPVLCRKKDSEATEKTPAADLNTVSPSTPF